MGASAGAAGAVGVAGATGVVVTSTGTGAAAGGGATTGAATGVVLTVSILFFLFYLTVKFSVFGRCLLIVYYTLCCNSGGVSAGGLGNTPAVGGA